MVTAGPIRDRARFERLVAEGESVPLEGWDFSWFEGRATEERPSWGYCTVVVPRLAAAAAVLDIQTGGGEVFAELIDRAGIVPPVLAATESYRSNLGPAIRTLAPLGVQVVEVPDDAALPFPDERFDLVISRHPTVTVWEGGGPDPEAGGYLSLPAGRGRIRTGS